MSERERIWILGAREGIGAALARAWAARYGPGRIAALDQVRAAQIVTVNLTGSFQLAQQGRRDLIYSATKAGVINLAQSLHAEWAGRLDVRLISPGFVDTRLTRRNDFAMPAMVSPEVAAAAILRGLNRRGFEVHFSRRLTLALKLLVLLPYRVSLPLTARLGKSES